MVWWAVLMPSASALLVPALRRRPRLMAGAALAAPILALAALGRTVASGATAAVWGWGPRLQLRLELSGFSLVMALLVSTIAVPVVAYALSAEKEGRAPLVALLLAFVGAMELLVLAADFLTLLVAWELVGALSWSLIGHGWTGSDNVRRAGHAFLTTRLGDLGLYLAAGAAFAAGGDLRFSSVQQADGVTLGLVAGGVLLAGAAKSAQLPFAPWLFSAMAGPTPVSALLHSATMVASGAYLLIRLEPALQPVGWFGPAATAVGLATALAGGVVAVVQTHPKKVLAASTSAQYGLMFVAVGAGFPAVAGVHLVAHAFFKALLFLSTGVAIHASGSADLAHMRLGRSLRGIAALSAVGALALAAVPPMGGAWSKEQIVAAAAHTSPLLAGGVLAAGFLSAVYALRYQLLAYGRSELRTGTGDRAVDGNRGDAGWQPSRTVTASLAGLALASVLLSVLWLPGAAGTVQEIAGGEVAATTPAELAVSLALVAAAVVVVWSLASRQRLVSMGVPARFSAGIAEWMRLADLSRILAVDPVLRLSRKLDRFDERVIDAGVRGSEAIARSASRLLSTRVELGFDSLVRAVAAATLLAARGSRDADDQAVDRAVEGLAGGIGLAGRGTRRLQSGMTHHYYVVVAAGLALVAGVLALGR